VEGLSPKGAGAAAGKPVDGPSRTSRRTPDLKASTLVVLGATNPVLNRLFGSVKVPEEKGSASRFRKNPWNSGKVVGIFHARSAEEAAAGFHEVPTTANTAAWAFDKGRNRDKRIDAAERGIVLALHEEPVVIDLSLLRKFPAIARARQANA